MRREIQETREERHVMVSRRDSRARIYVIRHPGADNLSNTREEIEYDSTGEEGTELEI